MKKLLDVMIDIETLSLSANAAIIPLAMGMTVACVEQAPLVSIAAMCVSGWIVYRLNKGEKGGKA